MPKIIFPTAHDYLCKQGQTLPNIAEPRASVIHDEIMSAIIELARWLNDEYGITPFFGQEIEFRVRKTPYSSLRGQVAKPLFPGCTSLGQNFDALCRAYAETYDKPPESINGYQGIRDDKRTPAGVALTSYLYHQSTISHTLLPPRKESELTDGHNNELRLVKKDPITALNDYAEALQTLYTVAGLCGLPINGPRSVHNNFSFEHCGKNIFPAPGGREVDLPWTRILDGILHSFIHHCDWHILSSRDVADNDSTLFGKLIRLSVSRTTEFRYSNQRVEWRGYPNRERNKQSFPDKATEILLILMGTYFGLQHSYDTAALPVYGMKVQSPRLATKGFVELAGVLSNAILEPSGNIKIDKNYMRMNLLWPTTKKEIKKWGLEGVPTEKLIHDFSNTRIIGNKIIWSGVFHDAFAQQDPSKSYILFRGTTTKYVGRATKPADGISPMQELFPSLYQSYSMTLNATPSNQQTSPPTPGSPPFSGPHPH